LSSKIYKDEIGEENNEIKYKDVTWNLCF